MKIVLTPFMVHGDPMNSQNCSTSDEKFNYSYTQSKNVPLPLSIYPDPDFLPTRYLAAIFGTRPITMSKKRIINPVSGASLNKTGANVVGQHPYSTKKGFFGSFKKISQKNIVNNCLT